VFEILYVPGGRYTACPTGQASIAFWIAAVSSVAPLPAALYGGFFTLIATGKVGIPPGTPAAQTIWRSLGRMAAGMAPELIVRTISTAENLKPRRLCCHSKRRDEKESVILIGTPDRDAQCPPRFRAIPPSPKRVITLLHLAVRQQARCSKERLS